MSKSKFEVKNKRNEHQVWRGYYPGSGFAFAETVDGWSYEVDHEVLFGHRLPDPVPRLTVGKLSRGELPDTLAMAGSGILVSSRLSAVLEWGAGQHIQFIPAAIKRVRDERYSLANLLSLVPCLDRERSDFDTFDAPPHAIRTMRKMVLAPILPEAPAIFHMREMPGVILVRDDLREAMCEASSSAGEFLPVSSFRRGLTG